MKDADYYEQNPLEFDTLSDEEKDRVINGEDLEGETPETPEPSVPPATEDEPVLLAKDGVHTIPYDQLVEARKSAAEWQQFATQQQDLIKSLQAAKLDDAGTGDTKAQDAVVAEYEGAFPEVAEDLKPYIQRMIDDGVKSVLAEFKGEIDKRVAPVEQTSQEMAAERYFKSIRDAHPDADDIVDDTKFKDWIKSQPSAVQNLYAENLEYKRPAKDLIEMFSAYKKATETNTAAADAAAKSSDIIAKTKRTGPSSLTDIPSTTTGKHDEIEAIYAMTPAQLEAKFFGKSPEEINKLMAKLI